jgi:hypothetical protein
MATQEYAASIQGVSIRVTRLDSAGNLLNGAGDSYVTSAFMRVSFTPEYEEGDEITEKNANGIVCVTYKAPDVLKRITMELAICEPDSEISQLISGGLLLRKTIDGVSKSVGWAAPGVGDDPAGNGVAIEVWSHAVKDGKRSSVLPYFHWVFPFVKMRQSGDRVIENGMLATTFEGYGLGNPKFGAGLDGRWEFPVAAERPYSYARADWAPQGLQGFYTWTDVASELVYFTKAGIQGATVNTIASITAVNTTATITFTGAGSAPSLGLDDNYKIAVTNAGDAFNTGSDGVAISVPSPSGNTITYTIANVGTTQITATLTKDTRVQLVDRGSVAETPTYTAVTSNAIDSAYANGTGTGTYNVPGSSTYNSDNNIDYIIKSNNE